MVRHTGPRAAPGSPHLDFINTNGELICSKRQGSRAASPSSATAACVCAKCEDAVDSASSPLTTRSSSASAAAAAASSVAKGQVIVRHNGHHDVLVPTNPENSEFAVVCQQVANHCKQQPFDPNATPLGEPVACNCCTHDLWEADLTDPASLLEWCDSIKLVDSAEIDAISGIGLLHGDGAGL